MAYEKRRLREVDTAGSYSKLQQLTSTQDGTEVLSFGVTTLDSDSTNGNAFSMASPKSGGVHKYVAVTLGTTEEVALAHASTAVTYFGSTNGVLTFSTGAGEKWIQLVATSDVQWAIVAQSTGVTLSA